MKMKGIFLATILTAVLCISGNVYAVLSGSGTEIDPYLIQSREDFDEFTNPNNAALYWMFETYTKLMCDLNLSGTTYTQAVIAPDMDNTDWNFQGMPFFGVFDGNGHVISSLTIDAMTQDNIGLFGYVGGQIKNLGVTNVNITGRNCVGGLVGWNEGTITACYATGSVNGAGVENWYIGGLVGLNFFGTLTNCYAAGSVSGTDSTGVGGLVGDNELGTLTNCYSTGAVSGYGGVGGLAGWNSYGSLISCYATGSVSGNSFDVGGLVGYSAGDAPLIACFWDFQTSYQSVGVGYEEVPGGEVTGKSTAEMMTLSTFTDAGWDFSTTDGDPADWQMPVNSYPRLAWETFGSFGSLSVSISPADAVSAGAQWRRTGTTTWYNSGATESGIAVGSYAVEFKSVAGWISPANQNVTISGGSTTNASGTYVLQTETGSLNVTISPAGAVSAGAQWRRVGTTPWFNSGDTEIGVAAGSCDVEFKTISGWSTPANISVMITAGQVTNAGGTYIQALTTGSLQVTISPAEAVAAGAQWRRTGTTPWFNSGDTEPDVAEGSYEIEFSDIAGWTKPNDLSVTLSAGQLTESTAVYTKTSDSYEPDNTYNSAKNISTDGTLQVHSIYPAADIDFCKIVLDSAAIVTINVAATAGSNITANLYDQTLEYGYGGPIKYGSNYGSGSTANIAGELIAGTYYLKIFETSNSLTISEYSVSITKQIIPTYSGGSGTLADPYRISTKNDIFALAATPVHLAKNFILLNDIDMTGESFSRAVIAQDTDTTSWGSTYEFSGSFNGNGRKITNVNINAGGAQNHNLGLFGYIGYSGQVFDLGVENIVITGTTSQYVGAITGNNAGQISRCFSSGAINASTYCGGIAGYNGGTISDCYSQCSVSGNIAGGLLGQNYAKVFTSYSVGAVSGSSIGGLVGSNERVIALCYWNVISSGTSASGGGGVGITTSEMKNVDTYKGWGNNVWVIDSGNDYPRLAWQSTSGTAISDPARTYAGGSGTVASPYQIATEDQLCQIGWYPDDWNKCFVLTTDLDLNGSSTYKYIADFTGVFDGEGYSIKNIEVLMPDATCIGFVGFLNGGSAVLRNLHLIDVTVVAKNTVGALVGWDEYGTKVESCSVSGSVSGNQYVGGLLGVYRGYTLLNCIADVDVRGSAFVGGFVGSNSYGNLSSSAAIGTVQAGFYAGGFAGVNYGDIQNCYAVVDVNVTSQSQYCGGFIGYNGGGYASQKVAKCYAAGIVKGTQKPIGGFIGYCYSVNLSDCMWNSDLYAAAGLAIPISIGQTYTSNVVNLQALTTSQCKTQANFTSSGWDFAGETTNGTADIWRMCVDGVSYPRFVWEFNSFGDFVCPDGVRFEDFAVLSKAWLSSTGGAGWNSTCDIGAVDGKIDNLDLMTFAQHWLEGV
jgi:hypothetical protein